MIDEATINDWVNEFIGALRQSKKKGRAARKKIEGELRLLTTDDKEIHNVLDRLEEAGDEYKESTPETGVSEKDIIKTIDKLLSNVTIYKGSSGRATSLKYSHLDNLDIQSLSLQKNVDKIAWNIFKEGVKAILQKGREHGLEHINKLQLVLEHLSENWHKGASSQDIDIVITRAKDIFDEIVEADLTLARDRKKVYKYWRGISLKHHVLEDKITELKDIAKEAEIPEEVKISIDKLQTPPNYVKKFKPFKMKGLKKPEMRIMDFLVSEFGNLSVPLGKPNIYEEEHEGYQTGEFLSQQKPYTHGGSSVPKSGTTLGVKRVLSGKEQAFLSEGSLDALDYITEGFVDPLLWYVIDEIDIPVTMIDSFEMDWEKFGEDDSGLLSEHGEMYDMLNGVITALNDSPQKDRLNKTLEELGKTAGEKVDAYLPIANWLKDIEGLPYVEDMDKIERDTGVFFDQLGEIFIEGATAASPRKEMKDVEFLEGVKRPKYAKGQKGGREDEGRGYPLSGAFPVAIDPNWPKHRSSQVSGAPATSAHDSQKTSMGIKPTQIGLREKRGQRYVPAKKRKITDENFDKIQKKLFEIINEYYFEPLDKSGKHFATGEKPKFTDDIKGEFPYRLIKFNFSSTPSAKAERQLLEGSASEINVGNLTKIKNYLGSIASEQIHQGIPKYIREVELTVKALNQIFPNSDEENEIWGAGKIGRALERTLSEVDINEIKPNENGRGGYFNKPLGPLYEKAKKYEGNLPINSLRTFLVGSNLQNTLRAQSQWGESKDSKIIFELIRDIVDLTDPEKVNTDNEVNKAILKIHDSIRKMENLPVVYGAMYLDDINTMDYIITKMEREFRLDVTALEINNIVKSCDSFENLSEKYGIGKEAIYVIKGLCR